MFIDGTQQNAAAVRGHSYSFLFLPRRGEMVITETQTSAVKPALCVDETAAVGWIDACDYRGE